LFLLKQKQRVDFAIGNIENRVNYSAFVDFTTPIITDQHFVALVARSHAQGLCTVEDLLDDSRQNPQWKIGCLGLDSFNQLFRDSNVGNTITKKLFKRVKGPPVNIEHRQLELVIARLNSTRFALLLESNYAHYLAGYNCNLAVLTANESVMPRREIAIPLPKGSKLLEPFNRAIEELQQEGEIERLQQAHFRTFCPEPDWSPKNCGKRRK